MTQVHIVLGGRECVRHFSSLREALETPAVRWRLWCRRLAREIVVSAADDCAESFTAVCKETAQEIVKYL
jgi:hypothetical protein